MQWHTFGQLPNLHYEGTITARETEAILIELTNFWYHLLMAILKAYPDNDWDAIECTLWANSGRLIAYPYRTDERFQRRERVSIQVRLDALNEDDPSSMQQYNDDTDALVQRYWDWLIEAARRDPAASLIQQIRQQRPMAVYACEEHPSTDDMMFLLI
jgi:hypothetical protein